MLDSPIWQQFVDEDELKYVTETMDRQQVTARAVTSMLEHGQKTPRQDPPQAVRITFPAGMRTHVCTEASRTLCGQRLLPGRPLHAEVTDILPTCSHCLTSGAPWILPRGDARKRAEQVAACSAKRKC